MRAITFDGNIVSEAKDIADASTTSENTITIQLQLFRLSSKHKAQTRCPRGHKHEEKAVIPPCFY